jgi:hypothetical protein
MNQPSEDDLHADMIGLALEALDKGFVRHIAKLTGVALSDPSGNCEERFGRGVNQSCEIYLRLREFLKAEQRL